MSRMKLIKTHVEVDHKFAEVYTKFAEVYTMFSITNQNQL